MAGASEKRVLIVGAGLAGSLMACYLARAGWRVSVYERRGDPRAKGYAGGRSINLALSARGIAGLAGVGLEREILARAIRMPGRMIHPVSGPLVFQPYSADPGDAINSISRGGLNLALIEAAARNEGVSLVFDHPCVDVDPEAPAAVFETPGGGTVRVGADLIIGADGAFSAVRARMQKADRFEYSQSYLEHGYKELHIPAVGGVGQPSRLPAGGTPPPRSAMEPGALHIWPRGGAMMIALPNPDGSFTCTLFWPYDGEHGLETLKTPEQVLAHFRKHYPDAVPLMPTLTEDYFRNPTGSLVTVRCWPWQIGGKVALLGDAAHAIVPFYGQGMNAAFEDCIALSACLAGHPRDQRAALEEYQSLRKPHADAIAEMAVENFVEMRDTVGSPAFRYKKRLEQKVHRLFPEAVTPQYNLVSFSTVPYAEARRRGRELEAMLARLVERVPAASADRLSEEEWGARVEAEAASLLVSPSSPPHLLTSPPPHLPNVVHDISPPLTPRTGVWPGDTPLSREVLCQIEKGDTVTLSTIRATVHLGAHADGPNHYGAGAEGIGERRLEHYLGPCQVVEARVARGGRVLAGDIAGGVESIRHPRVLIRTGTFPDPEKWNADFAGLSVELVEALAGRGVITIGIDTPSVDVQDSKDLPAHRAILRHDIAILEGLALAGAEPGEYELVALPLRLMGFDASPVRAVLRKLPAEPRA